MILQPLSLDELGKALASTHERGEKIDSVVLTALNRLVEHAPEDMTATVEAGMTLAALQSQLAQRGQWLPIDPPRPDRLTIGELLSQNVSGPRRYGYGPVRDYVIGLRVVLADGRLIKAGGKVVKNVAGYDLCKLFIGSRGTLGVIVEATFKLKPIPETEAFVQAEAKSLDEVDALLAAILDSDLTPAVLDLHNLTPPHVPRSDASRSDALHSHALTLVLGFAGAREDTDYQVAKAHELGVRSPSSLEHEETFWSDQAAGRVRHASVLPSEVTNVARQLAKVPFLARAGNGAIWYRGGPEQAKTDLPHKLFRRVKDTFDPKHILPELDVGRGGTRPYQA